MKGEKGELIAPAGAEGIIIGTNSEMCSSRQFNFVLTVSQSPRSSPLYNILSISLCNAHLRNLLHRSAGESSLPFFLTAEFFRCYSGGLHRRVVFHSRLCFLFPLLLRIVRSRPGRNGRARIRDAPSETRAGCCFRDIHYSSFVITFRI